MAAHRKAGTDAILAVDERRVLRPRAPTMSAVISRIRENLERSPGSECALVERLKPRATHMAVDGRRLERVLIDLVANAMVALPKGSQLTVETAETELIDEIQQEECTVARLRPFMLLNIRYEEIGADPASLESILEPIFTILRKKSGNAVVRLAELYNDVLESDGRISISGNGLSEATLKIYLPATGMGRSKGDVPVAS